jgi:hypothetical protein
LNAKNTTRYGATRPVTSGMLRAADSSACSGVCGYRQTRFANTCKHAGLVVGSNIAVAKLCCKVWEKPWAHCDKYRTLALGFVHHTSLSVDDGGDKVKERELLQIGLPDLGKGSVVILKHIGGKRPVTVIVAGSARLP